MSDAALDVQTAVLAQLVAQLSVPVYDHVPEETTFPFVTVGQDTQSDWSAEGLVGETHSLTVHTWSRHRGRKESKELMDEIKDALHEQALTLTGQALILLRWEYSDTVVDLDGLTYHGMQRFRALTQKT